MVKRFQFLNSRVLLFSALFAVSLFGFSHSAKAALTCELPNLPAQGQRDFSVDYKMVETLNYHVSGFIDFGDGSSIYNIAPAWKMVEGSKAHQFPPAGVFQVQLTCVSDAETVVVTQPYRVVGGGNPQCSNTIDDDGDGKIDFNGGPNGEPPDPDCTGPSDNSELGGSGGGTPPAVDVTITSNLGQGGWTLGPCPANPLSTTHCPITGNGTTGHYTGIYGSGNIHIAAKSVPGKTIFIRGCVDGTCFGPEEVNSQDLTVPDNRNQTVFVNWILDYENPGTQPPAAGVTLTPASTCVAPGSNLNVTWHNTSGVSASNDWLALVPKGGSWNGNWPWIYWNGTQVRTNSPVAPPDGSVALTVPAGTSPLQFVYYRNDGIVEAGRSADITVSDNCQNPPQVSASLACKDPTNPAAVWSAACTIPPSGNVQLQWSSVGATSCNVWGYLSWDGTRPTSGTELQGPLAVPTTFYAQCGGGGASSSVASVTVTPQAPTPTPGVDLKCRAAKGDAWSDGPCAVDLNGSIQLQWTSTSTVTCDAMGAWGGSKPLTGSESQGPIATFPKEYDIHCTTTNGFDVFDGVVVNQTNNNAPGTPAVSGLPACSVDSYTGTIAWSGQPDPVNGFFIDIALDRNFNSFYTKQTKGNSTDLTGFLGIYPAATESFVPAPGVTYFVRVFNGVHSPIASFTVPRCSGTHAACKDQSCIQVDGIGSNECSSNQNCGVPPYHNACSGQSCVRLNGPGVDSCADGGSCGGDPTRHAACVQKSCRLVNGPGADLCTSDAQCNEVCVGDSCGGSCTFTATPDRIVVPPPKSSQLSWSCVNVENCRISPSVGSVKVEGNALVAPEFSTEYTLTCDNTQTAGTYTTSTRVRVFKFEGGALKEVLP